MIYIYIYIYNLYVYIYIYIIYYNLYMHVFIICIAYRYIHACIISILQFTKSLYPYKINLYGKLCNSYNILLYII